MSWNVRVFYPSWKLFPCGFRAGKFCLSAHILTLLLLLPSCFCSFGAAAKNVEDRRICHAQSVYQGQSEPQISKLYCYYAASFPSQDSHPASSIRGCSSLHSGLLMNKHYQAFKKGQFETKILSNNIWKFLKKSQKMGILWFTFLFQFFNFFLRKER